MAKTASEIAQWVIDNRYSKSENDKVSDVEMFDYIKDEIDELIQGVYSEVNRV